MAQERFLLKYLTKDLSLWTFCCEWKWMKRRLLQNLAFRFNLIDWNTHWYACVCACSIYKGREFGYFQFLCIVATLLWWWCSHFSKRHHTALKHSLISVFASVIIVQSFYYFYSMCFWYHFLSEAVWDIPIISALMCSMIWCIELVYNFWFDDQGSEYWKCWVTLGMHMKRLVWCKLKTFWCHITQQEEAESTLLWHNAKWGHRLKNNLSCFKLL